MKLYGLPVLRRLRQILSYQALDSIVGKIVAVRSGETAPSDVIRGLNGHLPVKEGFIRNVSSCVEGPIAKYGILDLTFEVTEPGFALQRSGLQVFRDLGLVEKNSSAEDFVPDLLNQLAEEAEKGTPLLKIFLHAKQDLFYSDSSPEALERRAAEGLPREFWPHLFKVEDACLTNIDSIWLIKHFYM